MGLEIANWIAELVSSNPSASDPIGHGDDHMRTIKTVLKNTFVGDVPGGDTWDSDGGALTVGPVFLSGLTGLEDGTYSLTLANEQFLTGRNALDNGNIDICKVNAVDEVEFGTAVVNMPSGLVADVTGNLTGNVTGNADTATTAGTVTDAAQPAITSVGTLTGLTVTAPISGSITGNAATADKWANARTLTLGGDLTGNAAFDGSANFTLTAVVVDNSHAHTGSTISALDAGDVTTGVFNAARIPNPLNQNTTGTAATVTTAAQPTITSVGTLTNLTVGDLSGSGIRNVAADANGKLVIGGGGALTPLVSVRIAANGTQVGTAIGVTLLQGTGASSIRVSHDVITANNVGWHIAVINSLAFSCNVTNLGSTFTDIRIHDQNNSLAEAEICLLIYDLG